MVEVELSLGEMLVAGNAGVLRRVNALRRALNDPDAHHRDAMEAHVAGTIAEWAVAKWRGVFWQPTIGITWAGQVGGDVGQIEIRSTPLAQGKLIAHDYSFDDRPYLLVVTTREPIYELSGWLYGHECKQRKYWRENVPRPAYFIPQSDLRPVEELP